MDLQAGFNKYIQQHHLFTVKDKLLLAVSGGVDSVVLCELCKQAGYTFGIAHCNFQLRGEDSTRDEGFVQQLAKNYNAVFYSISFDTAAIAKKEKKSVEATARDLRYAWFEKIRNESGYDFIVTAHHAGDNIETVLMNFFRGTGIKGLHGILPKQKKIVRPLLFAAKNELAGFAAQYQLAFVTDDTNAENEFTRNYFRNELIPGIKKVFPAAEENILKNITRFGEAEQLYNQAIAMHKTKLLEQKGNEVHIPVLKLQQCTPLATIVYEIIKDYDFTAHQTEEVTALLQSESGKYVQSPTHRVIRNRKWLIISPNQTTEAQHILIEATDKQVCFETGTLKIKQLPVTTNPVRPGHPGGHQPPTTNLIAQLDCNDITFPLLLRKWKAGDYFYPLGMQNLPAGRHGKKKLSRFLTDQKLSLTEKEKVWVLESSKKIIWVIGMRIDDRFKITPATKNILHIEMRVL